MSIYVAAKFIHILSICMMLGATLCNGALHMRAMKVGGLAQMSSLLDGIMHINRLIMAPSFVGIVASGTVLAFAQGYSFGEVWLGLSLALTTCVIIAFLIGYRMERRIENIIEDAVEQGARERPAAYWAMVRRAVPVGSIATLLSFAILYLMITKP